MLETEEPPTDADPPEPCQQESAWWGPTLFDRLYRGNPNASITIITSSSKSNWACRTAHASLFHYGIQHGTLSRHGRVVLTLEVSNAQIDAYKAACSRPDDQLRSYFASLLFENLLSIGWVAGTIDDKKILRLVLWNLERTIAPFRSWSMHCASPFIARPPADAALLPNALELAMLLDLIRADWMRPVCLDWLARLSAVTNIIVPLHLPGRGRADTVDLPFFFLKHLGDGHFKGAAYAQNLVNHRVNMHTMLPFPPHECTDAARCTPMRKALFAQLRSEPALLGLEPLSGELVAQVGRCDTCKQTAVEVDNDWTIGLHRSLLQMFSLDTTYEELVAARKDFYEAS
ncbi:hypothetical protein K525DRAFT_246995 [Schizophyllum commune Loenen D]|nr:hypothetical protein K525DRAFT_246995 [Schizophyllum commune Loenen D]